MFSPQHTLLCRYRYDPLDRLISHAQSTAPRNRFYCKTRLVTEIQGALRHSIVQHGDLLLAQLQHESDAFGTTLLATDLQRSVLHTLEKNTGRQPIAYSPYGHRSAESGLISLLGFNGERPDPVTGHYLLGNGYRAFNPVLMRFNSPDSLSPFGHGGLNSYAYCLGDPINASDTNGHASLFTGAQLVRWGRRATMQLVDKNKEIILKQYNTVEIVAKLRPGMSAKQAVAARAKINKMEYLMDHAPKNVKFHSEFEAAKKHAIAIENLTGSPASGNERLNFFKSIDGGDSSRPTLDFSLQKLDDIKHGNFDPTIPIFQRPNSQTARKFLDELSAMHSSNEIIYLDEIERITKLHFQEPYTRKIQRIRTTQ